MESTKKTYDSINIMRVICAILVITIHTSALYDLGKIPGETLSLGIARIAVPFFFITAGYFYYERFNQKGYLFKYLKRIFIYYLGFSFAYTILAFSYIKQRNYSLELIIKDFLFDGFSPTLWYLPALILSIVVVALFLRKNWVKGLMLLSVIVYAIGLLGDTYYGLIEGTAIQNIVNGYNSIFVHTRNGVCFGVPFLTIGILINKYNLNDKIKKSTLFIILSSVIFGIEAYLLIVNNIPIDHNMYISLALVVPFIFIGLLNSKIGISERRSKLFRDMSLWIYCIHELVMITIMKYAPKVAMHSVILFLVVAGISVTIAYIAVRKKSPDYQTFKKKEGFIVAAILACSVLIIAAGNSKLPSTQATASGGATAIFDKIDEKAPTSNIIGPMWKISKDDEKIYLYGTVNFGTKDMYPLSPKVEDAIKQSEGLVVEANSNKIDPRKVNDMINLKQGDTYEKHVSKEAIDIYKDKVKEFEKILNTKIDYEKLKPIKPSYLAMNCIDTYIQTYKDNVRYYPNLYILYRANKDKLPIIEITDPYTSIQDSIDVPDEVADASLKLLKYYNENNMSKNLDILNAWKTGNLEEINNKLNDVYIVPDEEKENFKKLNNIVTQYDDTCTLKIKKEYTEKIDGYIKDKKNYFVEVSVQYLSGEDGILKELQDKGYTIEQVK
ncbi:acyltransferase family protein [Clostridium paridis]|uniref:Acyltransferase family protein n=1 Tax=Clostridium paridis TaxID=2803863 RepID=A0A937K3U1_9CLOT|nr:acyltransferase family protein [Clostridium paridis]MBL4931154.1 acyltransferase family protein [Clostridium paridis]